MAKKGTALPALTVKAYRGDAKTLLAFSLDQSQIKNLAGFTVQCQPQGQPAYHLQNSLQFQSPGQHAQDPKEPANSSINAPFHKFRWLHVPGLVHQGLEPSMGKYAYTVTPRYFDDNQSLLPLDQSLSVSLDTDESQSLDSEGRRHIRIVDGEKIIAVRIFASDAAAV